MPYKLLKQRVNTNFNRIIKPFRSRAAFTEWSERSDYIIETVADFSDCNLESAAAAYRVTIGDLAITVDLRIMQSTRQTSYCFDVFLMLRYDDADAIIDAVVNHYAMRLEALRRRYNGDWIIGDGDLTRSSLR